MNIFPKIGAVGVVCSIALNLNAESSHHDHDAPQQDAHLHGYTELMIAIEGSALEINFESPASSIVGFEHRATSSEQFQLIEEARGILESSTELFSFSGGVCSLSKANADFSSLAMLDTEHQGHEQDHSEITASYEYACSQAQSLDAISVNLISRFPRIEKIRTIWLTETKQGAAELTQKSNLFRIR
jgi:hypothetical protein